MADNHGNGGVSAQTDELGSTLMGEALDRLAAGEDFSVVATAADSQGQRMTCEFDDDSAEQCLEAARTWVRNGARAEHNARVIGTPTCYAIAYLGAVADEDDGFRDALILEFGERGAECGYSAFSLVEGIGAGDDLAWNDPAPAGETPSLL